jgi:uncharacterized protein
MSAQPEDRLSSLDLIRGVAVLGILPANLPHFLGPYTPAWTDRIAAAAVLFFIDAKMVTTLSILFGAGLGVQEGAARLRKKESAFRLAYLWRQLLLLALGLMHALLLWYGDILTAYAMIGVACLVLTLFGQGVVRGAMAAGLLWTYGVLLTFAVIVAAFPEAGRVPKPEPLGDTTGPPTSFFRSGGDLASRVEEYTRPENQIRIYRNGGFLDWVEHRAVFVLMFWVSLPLYFGWYLGACFLLGVQLLWAGVFHGGEVRHRYVRIFLALGLGVGVPLHLAAVAAHLLAPQTVWAGILNFGGALPMALMYMALLLLWDEAEGVFPGLRDRLRAVGRMALTNYLLQSVLLGLVFYSYGLGLFGKVGLAMALPLVPAIWALEVAWSKPWLERFGMGPIEWLWRSLAGRRKARGASEEPRA